MSFPYKEGDIVLTRDSVGDIFGVVFGINDINFKIKWLDNHQTNNYHVSDFVGEAWSVKCNVNDLSELEKIVLGIE